MNYLDTIKLLQRNADAIDKYFSTSPGTQGRSTAGAVLKALAVSNKRAVAALEQHAKEQLAKAQEPEPINWEALRLGLHAWRTAAGYSLRKAGELIGVKHHTLHRIEKGRQVRTNDYGRVAAAVFSQRSQ
ncbi:helix-turn-helix domain-containing protein [Tepidimonas sp.]|uniref:helix-turn-helix domain-containing protein n=1 Tax=Tepidimonas sp. TaxID=2002775 RepID=UPI00391B9EA1